MDLKYWNKEDLKKIGAKGFPLLNLDIDEQILEKFATEAAGSPQLMQAICLTACFEINSRKTLDNHRRFSYDKTLIEKILRRASEQTNFSTLVSILNNGPKTRGTERKTFSFKDGGEGDVYTCILKAIASDPPALYFDYDAIKARIHNVCLDNTPVGSSIITSCQQMHELAIESMPDQRVLEWDDDKQVLDVPEPYFVFYLRWSSHLAEICGISPN